MEICVIHLEPKSLPWETGKQLAVCMSLCVSVSIPEIPTLEAPGHREVLQAHWPLVGCLKGHCSLFTFSG